MSARMELVRRLFEVFDRDGVEGVLEIVPDDVVWVPSSGDGRRLVGAEVAEHLQAQASAGVQQDQRLLGIEEHGEDVVVQGSLRFSTASGHVDEQLYWVYRFEGDRLREALAFPTRRAAMQAVAERDAV